MIISFGFTSPALLVGHKTVTRRAWNERHARLFRPGQVVDAYDKSPRNGGRKVAEVRILSIDREPIAAMPDTDYAAEGFDWLYRQGHVPPKSAPFPDFTWVSFEAWRASGAVLYVVRFELVSVMTR